jgi:hypothetical protein
MERRTIEAIDRDGGRTKPAETEDAIPGWSARDWRAITLWAHELATVVGREQPTEHVAVFVPDAEAGGLRLAAQVWGAGENTGAVVVGDWVVPFDASICGRVFRTGHAALCADVAMDPDFRSWPGSRTRSSLTVPVGRLGAVLAVVNVEAPWVSAFSIRDYERLRDRAADAGEAWPVDVPASRPAADAE